MIPKTSAKEKYRTNPIFVALVHTLASFVRDGLGTIEDIEDAAHLARVTIEREREREKGAGR